MKKTFLKTHDYAYSDEEKYLQKIMMMWMMTIIIMILKVMTNNKNDDYFNERIKMMKIIIKTTT